MFHWNKNNGIIVLPSCVTNVKEEFYILSLYRPQREIKSAYGSVNVYMC